MSDILEQIKSLVCDKTCSDDNAEVVSVDGNYIKGLIGKKVIIRTYSAGVHFGTLIEKDGKEVILKDARRLWYWKTANNGLSLSEVAKFGVHSDSKLCTPVFSLWLEAIEIIPCTQKAIKNLEQQNDYQA